jgi:hypothetical protein
VNRRKGGLEVFLFPREEGLSMHRTTSRFRLACALLALTAFPVAVWGQTVIVLSDIVGNGDGSGTAVPGVIGINADTGIFETVHLHADVNNTGDGLEPVEDNPSINSVFIVTQEAMPINTDLVPFTFDTGDVPAPPRTWNWILKDVTHDFDKGFADIWAGGIDSFANGVAIHSSAGITFDLENIRADHGIANVKFLSCFAGHDQCGAPGSPVNLYAILSDDKQVLGSVSRIAVNGNQGAALELAIPDNALYLTLACGSSNGGDLGCDHGVFAEAVIASTPIKSGIRVTDTPGDPNACPPDAGGPVSVNIKREGTGTEAVTVTERAFGPFGQAQVTAQNGGVVSTLVPAASDTETTSGFVSAWLLLGPFSQPSTGGAAPGEDAMRLDYLTDGAGIEEIDIEPQAGDTVNTDYNGAAASTGLAVFTGGVNPGAVPRWAQWLDTDDTVNFGDYYGGDVNTIMMYAVTYLRVAADVDVDFCVGSDDAVQILLDGAEIHINNIGRGTGASESCTDTAVLFPTLTQTLSAGVHKLMMKVFEGDGGHGLRLGIFNAGTTEPADGVDICLNPLAPNPCPLNPVGVQVTWNTTRNQLNDPGVNYSVNVDTGNIRFRGTIEQRSILGTGGLGLSPPPVEYGPFTNPAFDHAHNIGAPCPGTEVTSPLPGTLVIAGAGADIWQGGDQFMYAYKPVTGDFSARVTITDRVFAVGSQWGKHGIMARQDCSTTSRYSFIHDQQDPDATRMANRPTHGGADNYENVPAAVAPDIHANTLRLDRCGNEFISFVQDEIGSFGGTPGEWIEVGRLDWGDTAPATVQLGLAVTSHAGCALTTITFEDWEVMTTCDAPVDNLACVPNAGGGLDLTWTNPPGANPAVAIRIEVNDAEVTTVPGSSTSASLPASAFPAGQVSTVDVINSSQVASRCSYPPSVNPSGFIKNWLILGPLMRPGGPAPGEDQIILDHLTDGVTIEADVMPVAGQSITPDYGNLAASTGLAPTPGRPDINAGGVPTWFEWNDPDDTVDYIDVFNSDINNVMCYAAAYVTVPTDTTVDIGCDSDDSIQILVDGVQVHINNISRGYLGPNTVVDTVAAVNLTAGCHVILVKVFDGVGGHGFRLRFQDASLPPIPAVPGAIDIECVEIVGPGGFRRGDSDTNGAVNITDAVRILNVLFLGIGTIVCDDAADSDDNGAVNITDAVRILNVLFLGIGTIPTPGADVCGPDPTDDALQCADYPEETC